MPIQALRLLECGLCLVFTALFMFVYPDINAVALDLGVVQVHWYGLMYLFGFALFWLLGSWRAKRADTVLNQEQVGDFLFYGALGVVIGGRIGYALFYNWEVTSSNPLTLLKVWEGGMSFHGGLLGVIVAMIWYARAVLKTSFWRLADFVAPLVPHGLLFGRIGNFINGELWGRPVEQSFAFAVQYEGVWRHPSMLYEAFGEGLLLFIVLWFYSAKPRPMMAVSGLFLAGYGAARFCVEFVRLPDAHIGYLLGTDWLTMGHVLTSPMILGGLALMIWGYIKHPVTAK